MSLVVICVSRLQGGNAAVRSSVKNGFLKPDSVLIDSLMVGNKGFDPAGFATTVDKLNKYREAELKHGERRHCKDFFSQLTSH